VELAYKNQTTDVTPRAEVFLLANDYRSGINQVDPDMPAQLADSNLFAVEALFWLSRCRTGGVGCSLVDAEFTVALRRELDALNNLGYELRGRMGFVIACKVSANCATNLPTSALLTRIERKWNSTNLSVADSALITTGNAAQFSSYGSKVPAGLPAWPFVYAFSMTDTDNDLVIDAQEVLAGTNEDAPNSDCDGQGLEDGVEFPLAGVSNSDPMSFSTTCADRRVVIKRTSSTNVQVEMRNVGISGSSNVVFYVSAQITDVTTKPRTFASVTVPPQCVAQRLPPVQTIPPNPLNYAYLCTFPSAPAGFVSTISFSIPAYATGTRTAVLNANVESLGTPAVDPAVINNTATGTFVF
jgi:hypothetical protein